MATLAAITTAFANKGFMTAPKVYSSHGKAPYGERILGPQEVDMRRFVAGLMLVGLSGVPAYADPPLPLKLDRDTSVRLFLQGGQGRIQGRLRGTDESSITLDTGGGHSERFSRAKLLTVMYGRRYRDRGKGALIGGLITAAAGIAVCAVAVANEPPQPPHSEQGQAVLAYAICGAGGAIPGMAIGWAIGPTSTEWYGVKPDGFTMAGAGSPRRATAALTVRFGH
jgi:hypothetical protein